MDLKVPEQLKEFEPLFTTSGPYNWQSHNPPAFHFQVNDPTVASNEEVFFLWTEKQVEIDVLFTYDFEGKSREVVREEHEMTHEKCLTYLAQLPKPWYLFTERTVK